MHLDERGLGSVPSLTPARIAADWLGLPESEVSGLPTRVLTAIAERVSKTDPEAELREELLGRLHDSLSTLNHVARTDQLTGLANRRAIEERLAEEVLRARRYQRDLTVFLLDVDGLKRVNDDHGHAAGDALLKEVARRLDAAVRLTDLAGRWGGDEFAVVCPETDGPGATVLAAKLEDAICGDAARFAGTIMPVRVSLGWAVDGTTGDAPSLLASADSALYAAKARGRNRLTR